MKSSLIPIHLSPVTGTYEIYTESIVMKLIKLKYEVCQIKIKIKLNLANYTLSFN